MKCEHCGCELDGNEKFCPLCGANLSNAVKTENKILLGKEKNNKRKWIIAILGIFVLFIIFSCIGVVGYNKQVAEKEAQQEAIQKKREKEQREAEEKAKEEAEEKERKEAEEKAKREAEFIFPYSDTENLTEPQLQSLSQDQLALARNEIIARHGRIFTDEPYKSYFESKSWYQGTIQPQEFDANYETVLNETEKVNIELIKTHETVFIKESYKKAYIGILRNENQAIVGNHYYYLYDMDKDAVPELIIAKGTSGDMMQCYIYSYDIEKAVAYCAGWIPAPSTRCFETKADLNMPGITVIMTYTGIPNAVALMLQDKTLVKVDELENEAILIEQYSQQELTRHEITDFSTLENM
ncbi:MAG: YARHG domain-containing protein [Faecalimonas sp.]